MCSGKCNYKTVPYKALPEAQQTTPARNIKEFFTRTLYRTVAHRVSDGTKGQSDTLPARVGNTNAITNLFATSINHNKMCIYYGMIGS